MTDAVLLAENESVQWFPPPEPDAATNYFDEQLEQYNFVLDEDTEIAAWPTGKELTLYSARSDVLVEFLNAQELATLTKTTIPKCVPDATTEFLHETGHRQNLVLDEGADTAWPQSTRTLWPPFSVEALFELLDELELTDSDITTGFSSVNESTPPPIKVQISTHVDNELEHLFSAAQEEQYEAGMESQFTRNLQQLYESNPEIVLQSLKARFESNIGNSGVLSKTLEWVSHLEGSTFSSDIVSVLLTGLNHSSPLVRDAAALGFAYFDERVAIGYIKQAIEKEDVPELREDLEDLVQSLEM